MYRARKGLRIKPSRGLGAQQRPDVNEEEILTKQRVLVVRGTYGEFRKVRKVKGKKRVGQRTITGRTKRAEGLLDYYPGR